MNELDRLEEKIHQALEFITKLKSENQALKKTLGFVRLKVEELLGRLERTGK